MARKPIVNTSINGNEYYRTSLTIGYDSQGKQIRKQFYGTSKTDAENKKKNYALMLETGVNPDLGSMSLEKAFSEWFWTIEKNSGNKTSTFERYETIYRNYIKDSMLGRIPVSDVKKIVIQKYYNELIDDGKSFVFIDKLHKLLNKFFKYAISEGYILRNPLTGLKLPKAHEDDIDESDEKIETFSVEELNTLINSMGNTKLRYIVQFAVLTGARMGEILALEKKDISDGIVKINKSMRTVRVYTDVDKYTYQKKVTRPKSESSIREIPIPEVLQKELRNLNVLVLEEKLKLGPDYIENGLLFPSLTGTYVDDKNLRTSWKRALDKADIPYKKFHSLRHTYATNLIENGVQLLTVSRLLGHSSIKTTQIYAHTLEEEKIKAVNTLNSIFQ